MGTLLGTVFKSSQPTQRLAASGMQPLNQTPRKTVTDSSFTLKITREQGESVRARSWKGAETLRPATSSPLGSSSPGARGGPEPGPGWGGSGRGPSLLTSRDPLLLTFSRSLSSAAFTRGRAEGPRAGERSRRGLSRQRPSSRPTSRRTAAVDAPTRAPRPGGRAVLSAPETSSEGSAGPPASARRRGRRPATPPCASRRPRGPGDALAPGPPLPSPSPGGGAREAVTSRGARWQHLPAR